jgi:carbamoyl-phosphate synthase large subunit
MNDIMKKILVTGAGGPAGVNFLRSLSISDEEMELYGTDINIYHIQFIKQWTKKTFLISRASSEQYIPNLNKIIDTYKIEFVHPQPDIEVSKISENRDELHALTFLPNKNTIKICQDKYQSAQIWKNADFHSVEAIEIRREHIKTDIERALNKYGKIWIRAKKGAGGRGSSPVENVDTGLNWINYWFSRDKDWQFIAQEYLPGKNYAFQSIFKDGELITSQSRERIEYIYPYLAPSGITGTPIVARTVHNKEVNKLATQAVLSIDSKATGIYCVDLKEDNKGNICPTEINAGRFFTTSYFFSYAAKKYNIPKANMPYLFIKLAYNEKIPKGPQYDILPENLYWIRHVDCSEHLIEEKNLKP